MKATPKKPISSPKAGKKTKPKKLFVYLVITGRLGMIVGGFKSLKKATNYRGSTNNYIKKIEIL